MNTIEITPELLAGLKEKAKKATPGPWNAAPRNCLSNIANSVFSSAFRITFSNYVGESKDREADAAYIAAANPQVVLALTARIEELEKENVNLSMYRLGASNNFDDYDRAINWICLALGIKTPTPIDFFFKDGAKPIIERIKEIKAHYRGLLYTVDMLANEIDENDEIMDEEVARLEGEADWLAMELEKREHGCEWCGTRCCSRHTSPCGYTGPDNWREAARKAVEENTK